MDITADLNRLQDLVRLEEKFSNITYAAYYSPPEYVTQAEVTRYEGMAERYEQALIKHRSEMYHKYGHDYGITSIDKQMDVRTDLGTQQGRADAIQFINGQRGWVSLEEAERLLEEDANKISEAERARKAEQLRKNLENARKRREQEKKEEENRKRREKLRVIRGGRGAAITGDGDHDVFEALLATAADAIPGFSVALTTLATQVIYRGLSAEGSTISPDNVARKQDQQLRECGGC